MIDKNLLRMTDMISVYRALTPSYYCSQSLPRRIKDIGTPLNKKLTDYLVDNKYYQHDHTRDAVNFTEEKDTWEENKTMFNNIIKTRDKVRAESFVDTFPELQEMYE